MKYVHKYNLQVTWNFREKWNITILSANSKNCMCWIPETEDEDFIINISIQLLNKCEKLVDDNFVAKGID